MIYRRKLHYIQKMSRIIRSKYSKNKLLRYKMVHHEQKISQNSQKICTIKYKLLRSNSFMLFNALASKKPVLLSEIPQPHYQRPKKAKVIVTKKQKLRKCIEVIPYEQQEHKIANLEIPFEQFLGYKGQLQLSIAQMNLQRQQVSIPMFVQNYFTDKRQGCISSTIQAINLWYYKGSKISDWHYDGHDNFLFVLKGKKIISLYQPNLVNMQTIKMNNFYFKSKNVFDDNANHADLSHLCDRYQKIVEEKKVVVKEGQCLFIPRGWWHYVYSTGAQNIAINVWGNSLKKQVSQNEEEIMLKHLISQVSERICKSIKGWNQIDSSKKNKYKQIYFQSYLKNFLMQK